MVSLLMCWMRGLIVEYIQNRHHRHSVILILWDRWYPNQATQVTVPVAQVILVVLNHLLKVVIAATPVVAQVILAVQ